MTTTTFPTNASLARTSTTRAAPRAPGFGLQIWNALTRLGEKRAAAQMRQLARQYDATRPELSRVLREAARQGLNG